MTPEGARSAARLLFALAAIGAVLVLGAQLVAPPLAVTAPVRVALDGLRFVGPPLALVIGVLAAVHARRLERRARSGTAADARGGTAADARGDARADAVFRALVAAAGVLIVVAVLSGLWTTLLLTAGALLP